MKNFNYKDFEVKVYLLGVSYSLFRIAEKITGIQEVQIQRNKETDEFRIATYLKEEGFMPDLGDTIFSMTGFGVWHTVSSVSIKPDERLIIIRCGENLNQDQKEDMDCGLLDYCGVKFE